MLAHELWTHRRMVYIALIWWISCRYVLVGLEYIFPIAKAVPSASAYLRMFGVIPAQLVGSWMLVTGLLGLFAQFFRRKKNYFPIPIMISFVMGSMAYSLFRISILLQASGWEDPGVVLFMCDLVVMIFLLHGIGYKEPKNQAC